MAVACSGLRFLITSLAIGTLYAHLTYQSFWRQLLFLVALILFSVLANGLRAFLLIYVAEKSNMAYGFGDDHYIYGWLVFGLVLLLMFKPGFTSLRNSFAVVRMPFASVTTSSFTSTTIT